MNDGKIALITTMAQATNTVADKMKDEEFKELIRTIGLAITNELLDIVFKGKEND